MDPVCVGMLVVEAGAEDVVAVGTWPTESESGNTVDEELVWVASPTSQLVAATALAKQASWKE
ncbi:MAG: hypothetical protein Q9193_002444 [Seirophora villosa]